MTSTALYTCYRQLHPPTGVDHAVFGSVTAAGSRDLIVAKASILELYRVHREHHPEENAGAAAAGPAADRAATTAAAGSSGDANNSSGVDNNNDGDGSYYLELAGTFPLAGNISSLAAIPVAAATTATTQKQQQQQQDILVVSFGAAKVALVAYDPLLGRLETLSIHNFDAGAIGPGAAGIESGYGLASALKDRPKTISSSEPSGRCLAAVVAGCQLVVLPVRRHVPRSVFVSEEAGRRRRLLRIRRRAAAAAAARGSSGGQEGAEAENAEAVEGGDGADAAQNSGYGGVSGGAAGRGSGSDDEDDYSVGARESDSEAGGGRGTGGTSGGSGTHAAVSKPFKIDLEEAGVTG